MRWLDLKLWCDHCGAAIESRPEKINDGMGDAVMRHRHIINKAEDCVVRGTAGPHRCDGVRDKYDEERFRRMANN